MPLVQVAKRAGKYRLVEKGTGRIAKTVNGKARDGGGHRASGKAYSQASYINTALKAKGYK